MRHSFYREKISFFTAKLVPNSPGVTDFICRRLASTSGEKIHIANRQGKTNRLTLPKIIRLPFIAISFFRRRRGGSYRGEHLVELGFVPKPVSHKALARSSRENRTLTRSASQFGNYTKPKLWLLELNGTDQSGELEHATIVFKIPPLRQKIGLLDQVGHTRTAGMNLLKLLLGHREHHQDLDPITIDVWQHPRRVGATRGQRA